MRTRTLNRWGSVAAIVGGGLLAAGFGMKPTFDVDVDPDTWQMIHKLLGVGSSLALLGLVRIYASVHERDRGWGLACFLFAFLAMFLAGAHFVIYENHVTPVALELLPETLAVDHPVHLALLDCVKASRVFSVIALLLFVPFVVTARPSKFEVLTGASVLVGLLGVTFWLALPLAAAKSGALLTASALAGGGVALFRRDR